MSSTSPANTQPDVGVLVAAAGKGQRAGDGEPKQFRPIAGIPMLLRALRPFAQHPRVREIVVALPAAVAERPPSWLESVAGQRLRLVAGGATRSASVRAALDALGLECKIVLVHDAARPFVSIDTIGAVIQAAGDVGVVPALPVTDTLKRGDVATGRVVATLDRTGLWRAHTPQGFPRAMLDEAYRQVSDEAAAGLTDESALVEAAGFPVRLVPDSGSNIKITTANDFAIAEVLASR